MENAMETVEAGARKIWRLVGYWGLTLNVVFLPALFVIIPSYLPNADLSYVSNHYPIMLGAWVAAAAVRQWGKNSGTE